MNRMTARAWEDNTVTELASSLLLLSLLSLACDGGNDESRYPAWLGRESFAKMKLWPILLPR